MTESNNDHETIRKYPPGFVYVPIVQPATTRRERICVFWVSTLIAIFFHVGLFFAVGHLIDWYYADVEIKMAWSDAPLSGFGMMEDIQDWSEAEDIEPPPEVEMEENPFDEPKESDDAPAPELDPNSIVIPDPEENDDEIDENAPIYDLKRNKKRLEAVRKDIRSLPNLHVLAPGNARLIVLIRNDRVLGSAFENSVRKLFMAFPDYKMTLGASQIDPVRDLNAMLIATANPMYLAETFLVVSHNLPIADLKKYISASFPVKIDWKTHNGHPIAIPDNTDGKFNPMSGYYRRSVYLPDDHTVLFLRPEVLPTLDVAHVDAVVNTRDNANAKDAQRLPTLLESLGGISLSDSDSMPTLFLMVQGIEQISLGRGFPKFETPTAMVGSLATTQSPHLNLSATFPSAEAASDFVSKWPQILRAAGGLGIPMLGSLLNGLALTNEDNTVLVSGDLNGTAIGLILMFAANSLNSRH